MNQNQMPNGESQGPVYVDNRIYNAPPSPTPPQNQPYYTIPSPEIETEPPMRIRDYLLLFLISCIPCVGLILHIVWAFADEPGKKSRQSYCRAYLIWMLISIGIGVLTYILTFVFMTLLGVTLADMITEYGPYYAALTALFH